MKKLINKKWIGCLFSVAIMHLECESECACDDTNSNSDGDTDSDADADADTDADTDTDTDADTDTDTDADTDTDTDADTDAAHGSFCNPLAYGGNAAVIRLLIGQGTDQVTLSASTGTCSNRLGNECAEIPEGDAVPLELQSEAGQTLYTSQLNIAAGTDYIFNTNVDGTNVILESGTLTEALECADMECIRGFYNELTCASDDPCSWSENQVCDEYCLDAIPSGASMFDDTADCV